jgi:hypothetical protein
VEVKSENRNATIRVDKDICLVKEHFKLDHIDYEHMSPVIVPRGYTKKFVDGEVSLHTQIDDVIGSVVKTCLLASLHLCAPKQKPSFFCISLADEAPVVLFCACVRL